jgi:(2Fe-2S) ferredoxin
MSVKHPEKHLFICTFGKFCSQKGSEEICSAMRQEVKEAELKGKVRINKAGCLDHCDNAPSAVVYPEGIWYGDLTAKDAKAIVQEHLKEGRPVTRLMLQD